MEQKVSYLCNGSIPCDGTGQLSGLPVLTISSSLSKFQGGTHHNISIPHGIILGAGVEVGANIWIPHPAGLSSHFVNNCECFLELRL